MTISVEKTALNIKNPQAGMNGDFLPALILDVTYNGKNYKVPVIYDPRLTMLAYSQVKDLQNFPYFFAIEEFRPQYYSGFQVSKNPGTPIIWIGSILVVFGMMLAFYTVHRKVWLRIENNKVKVAIYSHKFKEEFKKEFLEKLHLLS